jgi:hypothetical protein
MFAVLHSDTNSLKSGLLYLTRQPYCKKGRSAKVKDGIINSILRNYLTDRYRGWGLVYMLGSISWDVSLWQPFLALSDISE